MEKREKGQDPNNVAASVVVDESQANRKQSTWTNNVITAMWIGLNPGRYGELAGIEPFESVGEVSCCRA